ncbi:hypothetical protein J2W49_001513 [Hydrogenophaga palleronii]|uniref:Integral membrane protein n=1 Tax=Hydrogenophaga palleronii TaxID=65655 RepID=A0ABU1WK28_9BURK|nr:hypothetical protein [Hydrogenophaga palleronii]
MNLALLTRRYCLLLYWLMFALITLYQAQWPGLMLHPERWSYPWRAVAIVWALLAVLVGVLYVILRPETFHRSWGRLAGALVYAAGLLVVGILSVVTDMPGYYYVPAQFSVVTMAVMLIFAAFQVLSVLWCRRRNSA